MRDIAVVAYGRDLRPEPELVLSDVEMVTPVVGDTLARSGIDRRDIGVVVSGSSDYIAGVSFSFLWVLDAIGPGPSMAWSHVEADAAWALYEAYVRLQLGDIDSAMVFSFTTATRGDADRVLNLQFDPYTVAPLGIGSAGAAALQARRLLDRGLVSPRDLAAVAARAGRPAAPLADVTASEVDDLLSSPFVLDPFHRHDIGRYVDGVAVVVLAADDLARSVCERPAWIRGIDHRIEAPALGSRDLTVSTSTASAAKHAGWSDRPLDRTELHAPFSSQELILRRELGLADEALVNTSGGALVADPVMATGLVRIGEAAEHILTGRADRVGAHATSGPCLQHNLVCVMEAD